MNNQSIVILAVSTIIVSTVFYIRSLMGKVSKLENGIKEAKVQGEVSVNEERVNEATKRATTSLEYYRELKRKSNGSGNSKKP